MARYEHLPIYKQAFDVAVYMEKVVTNFSRYHKYTLGTELRNQSKKVVSLIVKANNTKTKRPVLIQLREQLDEFLLLLRMAKEVKAFKNFKSFHYSIEQVVFICRQNEGWLKSTVIKRG